MSFDPYKAPDSDLAQERYGDSALDALPASHGRRWLASFIDNMIIIVPMMAIVFAGVFLLTASSDDGSPGPLADLVGIVVQLGAVVGQIFYGSLFESSGWHATPGKKLLGLTVIREDGEFLTFSQALGRNVAKFVGLTMCGLIAISVLLDERHRGLWDRMANSRVVSANPYA